jgi:outer membrane lipoprotein SlyB
MDKKLVGLLVGAALGWLVKQAVAEALEDAGISPHAATVVGAIAGAVIS